MAQQGTTSVFAIAAVGRAREAAEDLEKILNQIQKPLDAFYHLTELMWQSPEVIRKSLRDEPQMYAASKAVAEKLDDIKKNCTAVIALLATTPIKHTPNPRGTQTRGARLSDKVIVEAQREHIESAIDLAQDCINTCEDWDKKLPSAMLKLARITTKDKHLENLNNLLLELMLAVTDATKPRHSRVTSVKQRADSDDHDERPPAKDEQPRERTAEEDT